MADPEERKYREIVVRLKVDRVDGPPMPMDLVAALVDVTLHPTTNAFAGTEGNRERGGGLDEGEYRIVDAEWLIFDE